MIWHWYYTRKEIKSTFSLLLNTFYLLASQDNKTGHSQGHQSWGKGWGEVGGGEGGGEEEGGGEGGLLKSNQKKNSPKLLSLTPIMCVPSLLLGSL